MSNPISFEDAFKTVVAGNRKKRKRERIRMALGCGTIPAIFVLGAIYSFVIAIVYQMFSPAMAGFFLLFCATVLCVLIQYTLRDMKNLEQIDLAVWRDHPKSFFCANELQQYGFYELALETYDKCLEKLFEESRNRADELMQFFEEFSTQTPFVGEFPRPVPEFVNHDLGEFDSLIAGRAQCFLQLGRKKEAEEATAQRAVIERIENEGRLLTKKYWVIEEDCD